MTVPSLCIPLGKANFPWYISKINKSAQPQLFPLALKPDDLAKSLRLAWNCSAVKGASQKCETEQNTGTSTSWNKVNKGMKGFWIDFALLHFSCSQRYAVIHLSMTIHKDYLCCIRIYLAVGLGANLAVVTRPAFLPAMIMLSSATFQGRQELAMWCFWHVLASRATVMVQLSGLGNPNQCPETQWFLGQNNEFENFHTQMSVPHCHIVYILLDTLDIYIFLIPPARAERCEFTAGAMERESLVFLGIHFIHFIIPSYLHPCLSTYPQPLHPFQWFWSQYPRWQAADA